MATKPAYIHITEKDEARVRSMIRRAHGRRQKVTQYAAAMASVTLDAAKLWARATLLRDEGYFTAATIMENTASTL
jgi:hypothetical protein